MALPDVASVIAWLSDGARSAPRPEAVLTELCDRLLGSGIPLWRVSVFVRTLHPEIVGRRFIWQQGTGVTVTEGLFELLETDRFQNSPFLAVIKSGHAIRQRLSGGASAQEFSIYRDLRDQGATDYFASPLIFTDGSVHVATWATQQAAALSTGKLPRSRPLWLPLPALRRFGRCNAPRPIYLMHMSGTMPAIGFSRVTFAAAILSVSIR